MAARRTTRHHGAATTFTVRFLLSRTEVSPRKLANAEVRFTGGALNGLTLPGFSIWVNEAGTGETVTFSSGRFIVSGQPRSFSLGRWIAKREAQERMSDAVMRSYRRHRRREIGRST